MLHLFLFLGIDPVDILLFSCDSFLGSSDDVFRI